MTELETLRREYDQLKSRHNLLLERLAQHFSLPIWSVESLGLSPQELVKLGLAKEDSLYGMFPFQTSDPKPILSVPDDASEREKLAHTPGAKGECHQYYV